MEGLMEKGVDTQILCRFYGTRVMTIHEQQTDLNVKSTFERGNPFPLFRGAPSKCILAHLSPQQLQRLFLYHSDEIASAGLGHNWIMFRNRMKEIRRVGYAVASDIDPKVVGVAGPIFSAPGVVAASICLVRLKEKTTDESLMYLGGLANNAGRLISEQFQAQKTSTSHNLRTHDPLS